MKIYCILNDAIPLGNKLETYLQSKGFHHFTQVTNCFSTTSTISLLTGKMPSDLKQGGIGYHTHFENKINGNTEYKWKDQLLTHKLYEQGWDIHFHNANWFYLTICNDKFIKKTTSMPITVEKEEEFRNKGNYNELLLDGNSDFYKKEKEFINKIQAEKTNKNKFYFIKNNQYHQTIASKGDKNKALDLIIKCFDYWDFEEDNALFWFFSDHHDFTMIDKLCKPPSVLSWACIKDIGLFMVSPLINYIQISDFINSENFEYNKNKDRIYFSEDGRLSIDPLKSTTAVACKFVNWINNKANTMVQVSYFKSENKYYGFMYNLNTKKLQVYPVMTELKEALQRRFSWVK